MNTIARTRVKRNCELMERICCRIADGESLAAICRDPDMPSCQTVLTWVAGDRRYQALYRTALLMRAELYADEITDLADSARGKSVTDITATKLAVNTRQWVASRLLPKQYGDRKMHDQRSEVIPDEVHVTQRLHHLLQKYIS